MTRIDDPRMPGPSRELADFCRAEYGRLVGALGLYCGDRDVAEDLAQEALARACRDWAKVRRLESPAAWTYRVGMNLANSYFRRKPAELRAKRRIVGRSTDPEPAEPDVVVSVRRAVASLPRRQRTALVLRFYVGLSGREIAEVMECAESTVRALTHRGMTRLRDDFGVVEGREISDAT